MLNFCKFFAYSVKQEKKSNKEKSDKFLSEGINQVFMNLWLSADRQSGLFSFSWMVARQCKITASPVGGAYSNENSWHSSGEIRGKEPVAMNQRGSQWPVYARRPEILRSDIDLFSWPSCFNFHRRKVKV
ncbi:hypothetical protein CEXT_3851 [Caerostris extrusa]|uniref:Uncharacterized protein n=1 Tax=Caerostris extrusa TaxID=172846 RepID=A0AAV4RMB5_CAEEX|nr:hypothetical protein CEXT_3851 [Caerostris extrusa]